MDDVEGREATYTILYGEPIPADLQIIAEESLPPGFRLEVVDSAARDELHRRIPNAAFLIVATARVDEALLEQAVRLRLVQHQGVGYNNIDVAACRRADVLVALTPEGTTIGVAEHTLLLILALYKHLRATDAAVRAGRWPVWELRSRSFELAGKTLGLVGFGRIGREVAKRARAFDATVVYYDPLPPTAEVAVALGATALSLDELLRRADIVSLHLPLTAGTRGIIGAREIDLMRPGALLINTARGPLIDERALTDALVAGRIGGAGLDVFEQEPPRADNPLLALDNVVLTPHVSAGTSDAFRAKMRAAMANIARVADGVLPAHQVQG
jgi:phosphoglycerate dehydrogenase-like enzyme